jgi:hypothetical protein
MPSCGAGADGGGGRRTDPAVSVIVRPVRRSRRSANGRDIVRAISQDLSAPSNLDAALNSALATSATTIYTLVLAAVPRNGFGPGY